jgi:UDP-hydrolysing UDP-N-acetyl-D-glucosamine 2-epimerase
MKRNKVMVVTTGRADYGLLYPLLKKLDKNNHFELQLIATGTHLSPLHGKTINLIEKDQLYITDKIEMTMKSDTENAICSSISIGLIGFSQLFDKVSPDLLLVLGDRYELWSVCMAAVIHKIPIAHIHGGEATFGLIDDPIRHSVTKMSAFHFASIDLYAKRIIQMGENPERVFVVGAIGLDNIENIPLMSLEELSEHSGVDFLDKKIALMTYHPVTLDNYNDGSLQIKEVLEAVLKSDYLAIMTMPNSDTSGNLIYEKLAIYSQKYPEKFKLVKNLGQKGYLSAMKHAEIMIGNSSSGIIESPSFKLPVVNIGDRQAGRYKPKNIIDCACKEISILEAINKASSDEFKQSIADLKSPYGDGHTSARIIEILESFEFDKISQFLKKGFYDLPDLSQIQLQKVI